MLANAPVTTQLPAEDLDRARAFYRDKLGLEPIEELNGMLRYRCAGGGDFALYLTGGQASGAHTQMCWEVPDIEAAVAELRAGGVVFEEYDFPGLKTVNGIADMAAEDAQSGDCLRGAWLKDSEGNLLALSQRVRG